MTDKNQVDQQEETRSYFDYINLDVPLPEYIPDFLKKIIVHCEDCAMLDDEVYYEWADCLDVTCKNAYAAGEIPKETWDLLTRRYHE